MHACLYPLAPAEFATSLLPQFLPQDKVVMFARLTPTELLRETEKSIGDGELYTIHQQLIDKKEEENEISHVRRIAHIVTHPYHQPWLSEFLKSSSPGRMAVPANSCKAFFMLLWLRSRRKCWRRS